MTLSPCYGREYTSAKAVKADWSSGKDFTIEDFSSPWCGKPINLEDAKAAGIGSVNIRFAKMTKVVVIKV
jgi:hypothetical protein